MKTVINTAYSHHTQLLKVKSDIFQLLQSVTFQLQYYFSTPSLKMNRLSPSDMPSNSIPQTWNLSKGAGTENEHQSASFYFPILWEIL